ncbi:capsule biosynthesis protein [Silicimonas sp. MF1-12-2]|uniref:capsule biosynthesis protein n=1 Tax=Silicimonas sp. MF1-12-2 TaxID=3384793 RepID=UPI0039B6D6A7
MTMQTRHPTRRFLFLQGPHGPFFAGLAARLRGAGAEVWRVGFNAGDQRLWRGPGYVPYQGSPEDWPGWLGLFLDTHGITDIVCYGATRPVHRAALELAKARELTPHVLEEGYLRPYWVTYERGGANAASPTARLSLDEMDRALRSGGQILTEAPDRWGDMQAHIFWGAVYHGLLMSGARHYPNFRPHRAPGVGREFRLHMIRLLEMPYRGLGRWLATQRIRLGGFPYHVVLLQLAHDANFRDNGPFDSQAAFLDAVFRGFAAGAPGHHHLVLKAHPLEDGREPLRPLIRRLARDHGLQGRVHFVSGGKLARLLDAARSAVTVNSTAAEQALWRGLPLKAFGEAVYRREDFVSEQSAEAFFRAPKTPDRNAYLTYRAFLLATSQVPGGFYAFRSRRKLLRQLPDLMLDAESPTERLLGADRADAAAPQHLRIVL